MNSQYSGVFTPTTPTLTPTTLRNIEQTILGLDPDQDVNQDKYGSFVPPLPNSIVLTNTWQGCSIMTEEDEDSFIPIVPPPTVKKPRGGRRATGGRRPNMNKLTPQEDERRVVRRERNKLAAARCRKRRVDHTNTLVEETEQLESTKLQIQKEINQLQLERDELEFVLQAHNTNCSKMPSLHSRVKKLRPNTLPVAPAVTSGIPLSTPSSGLNFGDLDWSELPSTGLTPTQNLVTPIVTPNTVQAILNTLGENKSIKCEFVSL